MGRMLNPKKKKSSTKPVVKDEKKVHVMDYSTISMEAAEALYSSYEGLLKTSLLKNSRSINIPDSLQQESIMGNLTGRVDTDPGVIITSGKKKIGDDLYGRCIDLWDDTPFATSKVIVSREDHGIYERAKEIVGELERSIKRKALGRNVLPVEDDVPF